MRKVLIIHYRVGRTDGVSIEISHWTKILRRERWKVETCAGPINTGADYVIRDLEPQCHKLIYTLDQESFGGFKKYSQKYFEKQYAKVQKCLFNAFCRVLSKSRPDRVIVSNIFSVGENIPAARALLQAVEKSNIPTIAIHHDFWWENNRYSRPSCNLVKNDLNEFMPPKGRLIKHVVINEIAKKELLKRRGIYSTIMHDCIDFLPPNKDHNGSCGKMLSAYGIKKQDIIVLQGTRIVHRKNIETAMDFVKMLSERLRTNGNRRVVFVLAGYAEKRDEWYQKSLRKYAKKLGIKIIEVVGLVNSYNRVDKNVCKILDIYPYADLITYPSVYEGFGNQFLEAVYAKKPLVMYEYPVYKTDIKPLGFKIISLGDEVKYNHKTSLAHIPKDQLDKAVSAAVDILEDGKEKKKIVEANFALGKKEFSFEKTARLWRKLL